jgi:hypothetical protein
VTRLAVLARTVAAAAMVAAGLVVPLSAAEAAGCATSDGVTVVVDYGPYGGIASGCVADGGGDTAASLFGQAGHDLRRAAQFPGAVCQVDGLPGDAECQSMPPADAYWGLFWSSGSGGWKYSSEGVDSLNVPDGGSVAFAWQNGGATDQPGLAPPSHGDSSPSGDPEPSDDSGSGSGPGQNGGPGSGGTSGPSHDGSDSRSAPIESPSASDPASTGPRKPEKGKHDESQKQHDKGDKGDKSDRSKTGGDEPSEEPTASESADAVLTSEPGSPSADDGLPVWVAPAGIGLLFAAAGAVALVRRRSAG